MVLRGIEVETDIGHVLVYGINDAFLNNFDIASIALPYEDVFRGAAELGCIAVGAHAGRPQIGLAEHVAERNVSLKSVGIIEALNGGSSEAENAVAMALAIDRGLQPAGGSDAHFVSAIGQCLTMFPERIRSEAQLVEALRSGEFEPITVDETLLGARRAKESTETHSTTTRSVYTEDDAPLEYEESVIGLEVQVGQIELTREMVRNYCEAIGETNPLYTDDAAAEAGPFGSILVPPALITTVLQGHGQDPKVSFGNTSFLAGTRLDWREPVKAGDTIGATSAVNEIYEKTGRSGRMVFVVNRTRYVNQDGDEIGSMDSSQVYRQVQARKE
jgi:acyl dehydratase